MKVQEPTRPYVEGCLVDIDIANKFADHFYVMCDKTNWFPIPTTVCHDSYNLYGKHNWSFNVDNVSNVAFNSLKRESGFC